MFSFNTTHDDNAKKTNLNSSMNRRQQSRQQQQQQQWPTSSVSRPSPPLPPAPPSSSWDLTPIIHQNDDDDVDDHVEGRRTLQQQQSSKYYKDHYDDNNNNKYYSDTPTSGAGGRQRQRRTTTTVRGGVQKSKQVDNEEEENEQEDTAAFLDAENVRNRAAAERFRWRLCAGMTFLNIVMSIGIAIMVINHNKSIQSSLVLSSSSSSSSSSSAIQQQEDTTVINNNNNDDVIDSVTTTVVGPPPTMEPTILSITSQPLVSPTTTTTPNVSPTTPTIPPVPEIVPTPNPTTTTTTARPTTTTATTVPMTPPTMLPTQSPLPPQPPTQTSNPGQGQQQDGSNSGESGSGIGRPLMSGPLVGHVTDSSVMLWAYHGPSITSTMEIVVYDSESSPSIGINDNIEYNDNAIVVTSQIVSPDPQRQNAYIATVGGLRPTTFYTYRMFINNEQVGSGSFRTSQQSSQNGGSGGVTFNYMLTSCMNIRQYRDQRVWTVALEQTRPEFAFLAGDTVYIEENADLDSNGAMIPSQLWNRNMEQRDEIHFKNFIRNVPIYSNWNDHEYGKNDSNMYQPGKEHSLQIFKSVWANPSYGLPPSVEGVFYTFYRGDVHYIVVDDRWNRDPATGRSFGPQQMEWIQQQLLESTGVFKIIVGGSDMTERNWDVDLHDLGEFVRTNRIMGILFHAGDIHRNEYKNLPVHTWPYMFKQITSSGIAKVWRRPFVNIKVDTTIDDPTITAHFYGANSTAVDTTWSNDPNLQCSSIVKNTGGRATDAQRDAEHSCTEVIRLSDLTF